MGNNDLIKNCALIGQSRENNQANNFQIYKVISPISGKTGGLLAVARGDRFLYACFMTLSS